MIAVLVESTDGNVSPSGLCFITDDSKGDNRQSSLGGVSDTDGAPLAKQKRDITVCIDDGSCKEQLQSALGFFIQAAQWVARHQQ